MEGASELGSVAIDGAVCVCQLLTGVRVPQIDQVEPMVLMKKASGSSQLERGNWNENGERERGGRERGGRERGGREVGWWGGGICK